MHAAIVYFITRLHIVNGVKLNYALIYLSDIYLLICHFPEKYSLVFVHATIVYFVTRLYIVNEVTLHCFNLFIRLIYLLIFQNLVWHSGQLAKAGKNIEKEKDINRFICDIMSTLI